MVSSKNVNTFSNYELSLGGHSLTIKSDQSEERMARIVSLANNRLSSTMSKNHSFQKSLMLALLQMSEEFLTLKEQLSQELERLESKASAAVRKFDEVLEEEGTS